MKTVNATDSHSVKDNVAMATKVAMAETIAVAINADDNVYANGNGNGKSSGVGNNCRGGGGKLVKPDNVLRSAGGNCANCTGSGIGNRNANSNVSQS